MKRGDKVRVKPFANVDHEFRGRYGTVTAADTTSGHGMISVEFDDEAVTHDFMAEDLEQME